MSCTSPIYRVNAKEGMKIPSFVKRKFYGYKDYLYLVDKKGVSESLFQKLPCGQCLSCRIKYAKTWAERCLFEASLYEKNYFFTLTYDDEHLPYADCGVPTLVKKDFQDFMKRFRKKFGKVRYFMCGEYGDRTYRPHYHSIMFGLKLDDLQVYKVVKRNDQVYTYYNSPSVDLTWGKGYVVIAECTPETCSYCARYSLKKVGFNTNKSTNLMRLDDPNISDLDFHKALQGCEFIQPVFCLMSRRPGISRNYYEDRKNEVLRLVKVPGSGVSSIRYFDKLLEKDFPVEFIGVREWRSQIYANKVNRGNYREEEYYDILRDKAKRKTDFRGSV